MSYIYSKKFTFYKRNPCKQIIMKEPLERIVMDITYPPNFLITKSKYKYILNIIDYFSKYLASYLIRKKDANILVENLKLYFKKY